MAALDAPFGFGRMRGNDLNAQLFTGFSEVREHFLPTISSPLPGLLVNHVDILFVGIESARNPVRIDPLPQHFHGGEDCFFFSKVSFSFVSGVVDQTHQATTVSTLFKPFMM